MNKNEYLGDSVYVDEVENAIVLTTNNGMGPSNVIVLEVETLKSFLTWCQARGWIKTTDGT